MLKRRFSLTLEFYKHSIFFNCRLFCFALIFQLEYSLIGYAYFIWESGFPELVFSFKAAYPSKKCYRDKLQSASNIERYLLFSITFSNHAFSYSMQAELYLQRVYKNVLKIFGQSALGGCPTLCKWQPLPTNIPLCGLGHMSAKVKFSGVLGSSCATKNVAA